MACPMRETKQCISTKDIKVPIIWVLGGPGSGKGTQCEKIVQTFGFVHLSTGDLLRDEVASGSNRGKNLQEVMNKGELVSNDTVLELLMEAIIRSMNSAKGFLIDGYPREKDQGAAFEHKVAPVTCILYFECSDHTMLNRLMNRAKTSNRADDKEDVFKKRIKMFNEQKDAIFKNYSSKIKKINGERDPGPIFDEVKPIINAFIK